MGLKSLTNGYTAWGNVRLVRGDCETKDLIQGITQGYRMKVLLQELTGDVPKGMESMDDLSSAQRSTRVNWFIDKLKKHEKLPHVTKVNSAMFGLSSAPDVLPILQLLVKGDITALWSVAPMFHKGVPTHATIAKPLQFGPCEITKIAKEKTETFYIDEKDGKPVEEQFIRKPYEAFCIDAPFFLIDLINSQLKTVPEGRKVHVECLADLANSRVLCTLVNSLLPNTFTSEVLLNDRWTINLALSTASEIFRVTSLVDSQDLYQNDEEAMSAFWTSFFLSGFQFSQANAVILKLRKLQETVEDIQNELDQRRKESEHTSLKRIEFLESKLLSKLKEVMWIRNVYDHEQCSAWVKHAATVQAKVRDKISRKMEERFDVLTVQKPISINDLTEELGIDLSLTGGNGFYLSTGKEKVWPERKVVLCDKNTGVYHDNFSGGKDMNGSVMKMLGIHGDREIPVIESYLYSDYEIYFESSTRNKILSGGTKFLYQVFPGNTGQCERLLYRAAHTGDIPTIKKLVIFFSKESKKFVNSQDRETGNSALHFACRQGHFNTALLLLESGADVNLQNSAGSTPFFMATEALHKPTCQLLLEWGADIHVKNRISKKALELIRNADLKTYLQEKFCEHQELQRQLQKGGRELVDQVLKDHLSKKKPFASLICRCCMNGDTLFHLSAEVGSEFGIQVFLSQHIDTNLLNTNNATPLHKARNPAIIKALLDHDADVNAVDKDGNTALHLVCSDRDNYHLLRDAITLLVSSSSQLDLPNSKGWLPIHCAAACGLIPAVETIVNLDKKGELNFLKEEETKYPSLVYFAISGNHLECAQWLASNGYSILHEHANQLLWNILQNPPPELSTVVGMVQFLLSHGANPDAPFTENNRPLHLLAPLLHLPELGDILLEAGAEVDSRNNALETPLACACKANNLFLARILIEKGADCRGTDSRGKHPFDYVQDHEEWIDSGHFTDDTRALLKAFSLRQARELVQTIAKTVQMKVRH